MGFKMPETFFSVEGSFFTDGDFLRVVVFFFFAAVAVVVGLGAAVVDLAAANKVFEALKTLEPPDAIGTVGLINDLGFSLGAFGDGDSAGKTSV